MTISSLMMYVFTKVSSIVKLHTPYSKYVFYIQLSNAYASRHLQVSQHYNLHFVLSFGQEYFLGVKAAGAYGCQPYHLHVPIVFKSVSLKLLEPWGPVQVCNGIALPLLSFGRDDFNFRAVFLHKHCYLEWKKYFKLNLPKLLTLQCWTKSIPN